MTREFKVGMTGKTTEGRLWEIVEDDQSRDFPLMAAVVHNGFKIHVWVSRQGGYADGPRNYGDLIHPDDAKEESSKSSSGADGAHTPGPWETGEASWNEDGEVRYTLHGVYEAKAADARLIGAAPDLLHALQMCVIERGDWLDEARRAIDKATRRRPTSPAI